MEYRVRALMRFSASGCLGEDAVRKWNSSGHCGGIGVSMAPGGSDFGMLNDKG